MCNIFLINKYPPNIYVVISNNTITLLNNDHKILPQSHDNRISGN